MRLLITLIFLGFVACESSQPERGHESSDGDPVSIQSTSVAPDLDRGPKQQSASPTELADPADLSRELRGEVPNFFTKRDVPTASSEEKKSAARSINQLAFNLYGKLGHSKDNLFFSPFSISTALSMTLGGARGPTASQLRGGLDVGLSNARWHAAMGNLGATVQSGSGCTLHTANGLWAAAAHPTLSSYSGLLRDNYWAEIESVDFQDEVEVCRTINTWVKDRTRNRIPHIVDENAIDSLTRMILVNAVYFRGDWLHVFDKRFTYPDDFYRLDGSNSVVPFMNQTGTFNFAEAGGVKVLELPYEGAAVSMLIILPNQKNGLSGLEKRLTATVLDKWSQTLRRTRVEVMLPRFTFETDLSLEKVLRSLGVVDAFDAEKADFSGVNGHKNDLYLDAVLHKAFVEVNEEGTEAAAATVSMAKSTGRPPPLPEFMADHPFVFFIRHKTTGAILFLGRLTDPS